MKVTIDFDGTLTREDVKKYIEKIREKGIQSYIVTSRFANSDNKDLFDYAKGIGFKESEVCFTSGQSKYRFIKRISPVLHLDNIGGVVNEITERTNAVGLNVNKEGWQSEADYILGIK